ncbi:MAG: DUF2845 domain-containing protein [Pseudomonadota bacterium]
MNRDSGPVSCRLRLMVAAAGLALSVGGFVPTASAVETLRCGDQLVARGYRPYEVRERCGVPGYEQQRAEWRYPGYLVYVDEWVYDLGDNRFRRELVFENGRLVDIELRPRPR